ncbi:MAG: helix-turn-helix transcriptional regulator [Phycicoccus sp.]
MVTDWWLHLTMVDAADPPVTTLALDRPPVVVAVGSAVHGTHRPRERWVLPTLWALHVYRYDGEVSIDRARCVIRPRAVSIVPPGAVMEYRFRGPSAHYYAHFTLPGREARRTVRMVHDPGVDGPALLDRLATASLADDRAERAAELWSVLWAVARSGAARPPDRAPLHPAVASALSYVEAHLDAPLTVARVAAEVRFSPSHLDRLVRAATGVSLSRHVRQRRMQVAQHLLRHTSQPVSTIASTVGYPDLQSFNKACRAVLGASPRRIRAG